MAQNGDPAKIEVAFAQTYFAVQTRKQEIIEQRLLDIERITAREKLPPAEDPTKIKRKLQNENKKALNAPKKNKKQKNSSAKKFHKII